MSPQACLACVDVPALPLQLLLRRHPDWRDAPAAVVSGGEARGPIVWVNREAVRQGARPGMRPAEAAACCPDLRVGRITDSETRAAVARLAERLYRWSPQVESAAEVRPSLAGFGAVGSFWLRASGLSTMFGSPSDWAGALRSDLEQIGFRSSTAVGFSRFGVFAAARALFGEQVFRTPAEEKRAAGRAPLVRFGLPDTLLADLEKLGVRRLEDLLRLSGRGLGNRYGEAARRLHRLASGEVEIRAARVFRPDPPVERRASFDPPESSHERLVFRAKRLLDEILAELTREGLAVLELSYELQREDGRIAAASVTPTGPSVDGLRLLSLLRLRIGTETCSGEASGVTDLVLSARAGLQVSEPQNLFEDPPARPGLREPLPEGRSSREATRRNRKPAAEALASLRAEFGEDALVRIESRNAHLPGARFRFVPVGPAEALETPPIRPDVRSGVRSDVRSDDSPDSSGSGCFPVRPKSVRPKSVGLTPDPFEGAESKPKPGALVRRIYDRPLPLPGPGGPEAPRDWLWRALERGPVRGCAGPYRVSGGWWRRLSGRPITRDYYFVRLERGEVCWIFFDRDRDSWFLEGRVE